MDLPDFFYQFYTKGKRMEQLASTLFDVFKYICGLTLLKYLHKKNWKLVKNVPWCLLWWRRHLLVRMQERWYDCFVRLCPDHSGIWISDRLVPAHWRAGGLQPTDGPAVAVGDTSVRIYLGSVNINLILIGIVLMYNHKHNPLHKALPCIALCPPHYSHEAPILLLQSY